MKKWFQKMKEMFLEKELQIVACVKDVTENERGDTNFISILIILGIVILLAGVFIGFKDTIVKQVKEIIDGFTIS